MSNEKMDCAEPREHILKNINKKLLEFMKDLDYVNSSEGAFFYRHASQITFRELKLSKQLLSNSQRVFTEISNLWEKEAAKAGDELCFLKDIMEEYELYDYDIDAMVDSPQFPKHYIAPNGRWVYLKKEVDAFLKENKPKRTNDNE
jgi:hypothetical protein